MRQEMMYVNTSINLKMSTYELASTSFGGLRPRTVQGIMHIQMQTAFSFKTRQIYQARNMHAIKR